MLELYCWVSRYRYNQHIATMTSGPTVLVLRRRGGLQECSHTYDASAGAARDINVHGIHARASMERLPEQGSEARAPAPEPQATAREHPGRERRSSPRGDAPLRRQANREISARGASPVIQQRDAARRAHLQAKAEAQAAADAQHHVAV